MYYNKEGKKIDLKTWSNHLEDGDYKIIKQETLPNGKWVSTVWLGLDYQFGKGKPLIFETMVFPKYPIKKGDFLDEDMERYSTLEEALKGHEEMVKKHNS